MAKKRTKKSKFRGRISKDMQRKAHSGYGYLNLPPNVSVFNEKPGSRVHLDFLPYVVTDPNHPDKDEDYGTAMQGEQWYKRPFKIHRDIGAQRIKVVCPTSVGKRCPICEYRAKLQAEKAPKEEIQALNPSSRVLYNVIPLDSKEHDPKVHIWDISRYAFEKLLFEEIQENEEYEDFPDLEIGYTVYVRFGTESIGTTNFAKASRISFVEREQPYDESMLDKVANLDEVLNIKSYKELEALFFEVEDVDLAEEDLQEEDETPKRAKKSLKKKPKPQPEEEDFDDDDEDFDDEEPEEEEPPKKPAKKSLRKPEPEPEPEDDDEDFEDADFDDDDEDFDDDDADFDDDDEDFDDDDEDFEDEEPEPEPPKRGRKTKNKPLKKKRGRKEEDDELPF